MAKSRRPPRQPSSQSWFLPLPERRELYLARTVPGIMTAIEQIYAQAGEELPAETRDRLEVLISRVMRGTWDEVGKVADELRSSLEMERSMRYRLESELRRHGLPVPTERKDFPDE